MWMGWERKRGKLHELNRLLRGAADTTFMAVDGHAPRCRPASAMSSRWMPTLACRLAPPGGWSERWRIRSTNRSFDPHAGVVVSGHGILQPRVTPSLPIGSEGSLFQRAFSGPNGLDPYALAVSDVYQDLFEEGSYCGKGIYDVDSFEAALEGQIPENTVLSHDLLEGIFARAGLVSDIEVVEEFPSRYDVSAARQHRWVRGDWQLLPWIFGFRRKRRNGARRSAIPLMGRWKLLDNLRRSLSAPAAFLGMLIALFQPIAAAEIWTAYILLTIALPPLLPAIAGIVPRRAGVSLRNHLRSIARRFRSRPGAERVPDHVPRASGMAHGRCDDAHAVSPFHQSATFAPVGDSVPDQGRFRGRSAWTCRAGHGMHGVCGPRGHRALFLRATDLAAGVAIRGLMGSVAACRPLGEPAAAGSWSSVDYTSRHIGAQAYRAADLAVLRKIRHCGRQHAPAR